jgi:hypothetical protein
MTPACRRILEQLTSDSIWIRNLKSPAPSPAAEAAQLGALALQCRSAHATLAAAGARATAAGGGGPASGAAASGSAAPPSSSSAPAAASQPSGEAPLPGARARSSPFARSEEAMAALTVAAPSSTLHQQQQQQQPVASSGKAGGAGGGPASPSAPPPATTTPEWAKALQAVVDAGEEAICREHRDAAKERVFG